jgi:hypothetical protein
MRRTTITLDDESARFVELTATESLFRRALEEWLVERGESIDVLASEGGRIRVMLRVAGDVLEDRALDAGYRGMVDWWMATDPGRMAARDSWVRRESARWEAEERPSGTHPGERGPAPRKPRR